MWGAWLRALLSLRLLSFLFFSLFQIIKKNEGKQATSNKQQQEKSGLHAFHHPFLFYSSSPTTTVIILGSSCICVYVCFVSHCWTQPWWERKEGGVRKVTSVFRRHRKPHSNPIIFVCLFVLIPPSFFTLHIFVSVWKAAQSFGSVLQVLVLFAVLRVTMFFYLFVFPLLRGFFAQKSEGKKTAKRKNEGVINESCF